MIFGSGHTFYFQNQDDIRLYDNCRYFKSKPNKVTCMWNVLAALQYNNGARSWGCDEGRSQVKGLISKYPKVFFFKTREALDHEIKVQFNWHKDC